MKPKKIIALVLFMILSQSSYAEGVYANTGLGLLDTNKMSRPGAGPMFRIGYLFAKSSFSFGLEAEVNPLIVKMKESDYTDYDSDRDIALILASEYNAYHSDRDRGLSLGSFFVVNFQIPDTKLIIRPKVGLVLPNLADNIYKDSSSLGYGMSIIYYLDKDLGLYASYGSFGSSTDQYSFGIEFFFR